MKTKYVFLDIETTGLNPRIAGLIQIALVGTDSEYNTIFEYESTIATSEVYFEKMDPFVRNMHTKNGLIDKVKSSNKSIGDVQNDIMKLFSVNLEYKKAVLAGNSVHFDRGFLVEHMPHVENFLHYRQLDVSSIGNFLENALGEKAKAHKAESTHTAMEDIKACIAQLKFYATLVQ